MEMEPKLMCVFEISDVMYIGIVITHMVMYNIVATSNVHAKAG